MNYRIEVLDTFKREAKRLAKHYPSFEHDFEKFLDDLEQHPLSGIDLGNGLRKIRMRITSKNKGKSGGARVITFSVVASLNETEVNLLYIYDKSERPNITKKELEEVLRKCGFFS